MGPVPALVHLPTGAYFLFDSSISGRAVCVISPGLERREDRVSLRGRESGEQLACVRAWLTYLKRELDSPDLWEEMRRKGSLPEIAAALIENAPFTAGERRAINSKLAVIRKHVLRMAHDLREQKSFIYDRIRYLERAVDRLGRRDWIHTAIGVFFTIATGMALAPEKAREFLTFALGAIGSLATILRFPRPK